MRRVVLTGCFLGALALVGCASANGSDSPEGPVAAAESAIAYGSSDASHTAVVALLADAGGGSFSECSGTIVQVKNGTAYILTAAHCCNMGAPSIAVFSNDYSVGENYIFGGTPVAPSHAVVSGSVYYDTAYDGQQYDFCMLKVAGVAPSTPVIPVALPGQDGLHVGVQVEHVGFGITDNNQNNSGRRTGTDTVDQGVSSVDITYSQGGPSHIPGPCEGDSGGPALMPAGAGQAQQKVVATTSYGNSSSCSQGSVGVSMRVTSETGPGGFITNFLNDTPSGTQVGGTSSSTSSSSGGGGTCASCQMSAQTGACASQAQTCGNDPACITLNDCLNACQTQACVSNCASQAGQTALGEYQGFVGCICNTACTTQCVTECGGSSSSSSSSSGSATTSTSTSGGTTATSGNSSSGGITTGNGSSSGATTGAGNGAGGAGGASAAGGTGGSSVGQKSGCAVNASGTGSDPASGASLAGLLLGAAVAFARRRRAS